MDRQIDRLKLPIPRCIRRIKKNEKFLEQISSFSFLKYNFIPFDERTIHGYIVSKTASTLDHIPKFPLVSFEILSIAKVS